MFCDQKVYVQIVNYKRFKFSIALVDLGGVYPSDQIILYFMQFQHFW